MKGSAVRVRLGAPFFQDMPLFLQVFAGFKIIESPNLFPAAFALAFQKAGKRLDRSNSVFALPPACGNSATRCAGRYRLDGRPPCAAVQARVDWVITAGSARAHYCIASG